MILSSKFEIEHNQESKSGVGVEISGNGECGNVGREERRRMNGRIRMRRRRKGNEEIWKWRTKEERPGTPHRTNGTQLIFQKSAFASKVSGEAKMVKRRSRG